MKAETAEAAVCGVWIEFLDARGNTLEQHVIDEWHGRPVPNRGDQFHVADVVGVRRHRGVVIARQFDLQHSPEGEPRMWVRLVIRVVECGVPATKKQAAQFSYN